jgi:FKBP-type peptidyl-prolyl cis-trans isomerase
MKRPWLPALLGLLVAVVACSCSTDNGSETVTTLDGFTAKSSYTLGQNFGNSIKRGAFEFDQAAMIQGLKDALAGNDPLLNQEEMSSIMRELTQKMQAAAQREQESDPQRAQLAEQNRTEGEAYLAENKNKPGVITTDSGLQYEVLAEGEGPQPTAASTVKVHYRGTLIDGKEFDSSYSRGEPTTFPVNRVIPGWTEALQMMKVGSKYRLAIPSYLAYGEGGAGGMIGPNATLIFEVELLEILD